MKIVLQADVTAPQTARSFVIQQLADRVLPRGVDLADVVLIVSELATNAVRAGAGQIELSVALSTGRLELFVEDDAEGWPTRGPLAAEATGGRGLRIVDQLAPAWDVSATRIGKRVTARWS